MKLSQTFFVAVQLPVSSDSSNASCVVNQRNRASFIESGVGLWDFMVLLPPSEPRPRLLVLLSTIPTRSLPAMIRAISPQSSSLLLRLLLSDLMPSLPPSRFFFSSPSPWFDTPENPNGANSDGVHSRGCMCDPRSHGTRSRADANMERAHPRMQTWNQQWPAYPWMLGLLVYFRLPSSPLLPFLHWSAVPPAGSSLQLWRLDASTIDPVHLYSCGPLSFVPVVLKCRAVSTSSAPSVHLVHRPCRTAHSFNDALCHLRACVMSRHNGTETKAWRGDTILRIFQRHKNGMKSTTLTWGPARRCRRRTCFSCRELMMERILLRSSRNLLTLMTNSYSHTRASVSSRIQYYIPADDAYWGSRVLRDDSDQYARWCARRCTLADSANQSNEMFESVWGLHVRQQRRRDKKMMCSDSPVVKPEDGVLSDYQILRWTFASWKQIRTPLRKNARPRQSLQSSLASRMEEESVYMLQTRVQ